jgi:ketosteroid isomerase-like protein
MRHIAGSEAGDASVIRRDYADDAIVIFGNQATAGIDAVEKVFENLYRRGGLKLDYETLEFEGEMAYTVWKTDGLRGSDSYVVRDGKITAQTGIVFREANEN